MTNTREVAARRGIAISEREKLALVSAVPVVLLALSMDGALFHNGSDFGTFYRAACSGLLYQNDPLSVHLGPVAFRNLNPPHFHLLLVPLCPLGLRASYYIWMAVTFSAIVGASVAIARAVGRQWVWWWSPVALASVASTMLVTTGQVTGALLVPLTLSWWYDRRGRQWLAGAWLGVAIALKPFLGLVMLVWVPRRAWRALVSAIVAIAISFGVSTVFYGLPNMLAWIRELRAVAWTWVPINASIWGVWMRTTLVVGGLDPSVGLVGGALTVGVVLVTTIWALTRSNNREVNWAIGVSAALLVSPLGWVYYGWLLIPLLAMQPLPRWAWIMGIVAWLIPPSQWPYRSPVHMILLGNIYGVGLFAVWAGLVHAAVRREMPAKAFMA